MHHEPHASSTSASAARVVAVGASAGGLEALETFFVGLGECPHAAFVVIQHLSPDHKSMMGHLLARHTPMPVVMAEDGMPLAPGHVYLLPPGSTMTTEHGRLWLTPKPGKGLSLPIDVFFRSAARACGTAAIGVVLSGTGSDGTRGAVSINEAGGLLFAQDPTQAKFDGMPRSVIHTGLVDFVLPVADMGPRLRRLVGEPVPPAPPASPPVDADEGSALQQILVLLQAVGGVDFRAYKPNTLMRRIERRLRVRQASSYAAYARILESDRDEAQLLQREILIPVTSFFRDADHFDALARLGVQPLVDRCDGTEDVRVWVSACSTGEEAYSIAILLLEAFERARKPPRLKVFATDVERQNLETASAGLFSDAAAGEVSPERLERYFKRRDGRYEISKSVRETIIFARHNVVSDPPFTRIDLVSCRNMLIYLQPDAQVRVLRRLQYALAPGGLLFLGSSESLGEVAGDFAPLDARHKIFRVLRRHDAPIDIGRERRLRVPALGADAAAGLDGLVDDAQRALQEAYLPPSVLVSAQREVLHVFGNTRPYLQLPEGQVSLDIVKLLPESLSAVGMALLQKASRDRTALRSSPLTTAFADGRQERVTMVVRPLPAARGALEPHLLLTFEGLDSGEAQAPGEGLDVPGETRAHIRHLEQELGAVRESLQATIEELETSNEELQATNEELMSSNEELQSSNEELQSVNEELHTVNTEHQEKIHILHRLNADLESMARAVSIATVFVDADLRITRFTREATRIWPLQDGDVGRPLQAFTHAMAYPDFIAQVRKTISGGVPVEREVRGPGGTVLMARVLPCVLGPGLADGAVISLVDITSIFTSRRLQGVLDALPNHIAELDGTGRITVINRAWNDFARANGDEHLAFTGVGVNYLDVCRRSDAPHAKVALHGLEDVIAARRQTFTLVYPCHAPDQQRWFLMHVSRVEADEPVTLVSHIDITAWAARCESPHAPACLQP